MDFTSSKRVLIGAAGTGTAFGAIAALRRVWSEHVYIVAMDVNPRHLVTASLLANHFEQVPAVASAQFLDVLAKIIRTHNLNTYMPLLPTEIALVAKLKAQNHLPATVSVLTPSPISSAICADKLELTRCLSSTGIAVPHTAIASNPFPADNYFIKPRKATGSRGASKISSAQLHNVSGNEADEWIVQEICSGPEITVDAFYSPEQEFLHAVCRERIEVKAGVSTKARLFMNAELEKLAARLADALQLTGSFCFQVMRGASNWVVTDVNPRPGAGTAMCLLTRNDFFAATFAYLWEEDPRVFFCPINGDVFVTRQYAEFLTAG